MLSAIYNLLWYPALPFALIAAHPANMRDYRERMGHGDFPETAGTPRIWIHAASVGEIEAIRPVAIGLLENYPGAIMAITTMTATGREAAKRRIPRAAAWMLAPLDNRRAVRSFLERVRPTVVLITETEIWPNYFLESARIGATIAVVNGRISERSMSRYMRARGLFRDALGRATLIMTQTNEDALRYARFDLPAKIIATGNTKIEAAKADAASEEPIRPELMGFASRAQNFYRRLDGAGRGGRDRGRVSRTAQGFSAARADDCTAPSRAHAGSRKRAARGLARLREGVGTQSHRTRRATRTC